MSYFTLDDYVKNVILAIIFIYIILIISLGMQASPVSASSYVYDYWGESVSGPPVYEIEEELYGADLGTDALTEPRDIFVDHQNDIYLADTGNDRLIVLNQDFNLIKVIDEYMDDGESIELESPGGIFVAENGNIYIAETEKQQILVLNNEGELKQIIDSPTNSQIIPEDFEFHPQKVVVDNFGSIYVIARNVLEGFLKFNPEGQFEGFVGAPNVAPNPMEVFWKNIMTEEQQGRMTRFLPTQYSNFTVGNSGFIYATISQGEVRQEEAIKKLSPSGTDVLVRDGFFPPVGDINYTQSDVFTVSGPSVLVDIAYNSEQEIYSALDRKRGRVFTYNERGDLLYAFGDLGENRGNNNVPVSIEYLEDYILILDQRLGSVNIYRPTNYTKTIWDAERFLRQGRYQDSAETWNRLLEFDPDYYLAHINLGFSRLRNGENEEAMQHFRRGMHREGYSKAWKRFRNTLLIENFQLIIISFLLILILIILFTKYRDSIKLEKKIDNQIYYSIKDLLAKITHAGRVIFHPFGGFWEIKVEKQANVISAVLMLGGLCGSFVLYRLYTGFLFNDLQLNEFNIYSEIISILIPFFLWCGVNWGLTTLMEGKGTFRDIFISTAYGLTPIIVLLLPLIPLSNFFSLEEASFYYLILAISVIWSAILVLLGNLVIHEYGLFKTIATAIFTIVGIMMVLFIFMLFFDVFTEFIDFVETLFLELSLRF